MEITVKYGSGRRFGINHSNGVGVFVQRECGSDNIEVNLAFVGARTPGDASWQASHFGNDASCDRAVISIEPEIAIRLAHALLKVASAAKQATDERFADEQKDRFSAETKVGPTTDSFGDRVQNVRLTEQAAGTKNALIDGASVNEEFDEVDDDLDDED